MKKLIIICLFALLIRLFFFFAVEPFQESNVLIGDANGYHKFGESILDTKSFKGIDANRTPIYPLFIAVIYFFIREPWVVLLVQVFLDTGLVIITYLIAREIFSERVSLIAAFLYAINFLSVYYSVRFLTEIVFTFIFALAILAFIRKRFIATVFFLALATLTRPILLYFPFLLLFFNRKMLIPLVIFFVLISPWQFRNLKTYGHYALSQKAGDTLLECNIAMIKLKTGEITEAEARRGVRGESEVENPLEESEISVKIALKYIFEHPFLYAKYHFLGILNMFLGIARSGMTELFGTKVVPALFLKQLVEYLFVLLGLFYMAKNKNFYLLLLIILYFANLTGVVGYSRFRVPITPFYLIISAKGIFETFKFIINKRRGQLIPISDV